MATMLMIPVACSDGPPTGASPATPDASALHTAVTGAAAAAIDRDGRIQLSAPKTTLAREVTAGEARAFASVWMRDYAPMLKSWLEQTHGAPINLKTITSCGRTLYARSALNAPPSNLPGAYQRTQGPWWLLTFCDAAGAPAVSLAVSAWATELSLQDGKLLFPKSSGTEFVAVGVPVGHVGEYPSSPEVAIRLAARQTGKRVSEVPELLTPMRTDGPPQFARWRMTLDGPSLVRSASGQREVKEIYVSPTRVGVKDIVVSVAAPVQPATIDLDWITQPVVGERQTANVAHATRSIAKLTRRINEPVRFEPISAPENH